MVLSKMSLILFLIGLLNNNKASESIYHYSHHNLMPHYNPYLPRSSIKENLLATLMPSTNLYHNKLATGFLHDPKNLYPLTTSSASWMYNLPFSIGSCDSLLIYEPEFHQCRADAAVYWRIDDVTVQRSSKHTCCFIWNLLDCMEEAILRRCEYAMDIFRRHRLDYIARIQSNPLCYYNLYGSWNCFLENWPLVIAFIILGLFISVIICVACWIFLCRKFCRKNKSISSDDDHRNQLDFDVEQARRSRRNHESTRVKQIIPEETIRQDMMDKELNDYEPPKRFHFHQHSRKKSPEPRSASVVSVRQIEI